jgi:hypothetical protein
MKCPLIADPVDLGAQSDLIGALERMSIEAVLAAPDGGSARASAQPVGDTLPRSR